VVSREGLEGSRGTDVSLRAKLLAAAALVVVVGAGAGQSTWAAFVATTENGGNAIASGTVSVTDNDGGPGILFSLSGLEPGDTSTACIKVTYTGSLPAALRLYGTSSGTLGSYASLTITRGAYSTEPSFGSCTNFSADTSTYVTGQAPGVVYAGTLGSFPTSWATGRADPAVSWATGESHVYKLQVTLGDNKAAAGTSAAHAFTWEARGV
jgi:hypothetical protein